MIANNRKGEYILVLSLAPAMNVEAEGKTPFFEAEQISLGNMVLLHILWSNAGALKSENRDTGHGR